MGCLSFRLSSIIDGLSYMFIVDYVLFGLFGVIVYYLAISSIYCCLLFFIKTRDYSRFLVYGLSFIRYCKICISLQKRAVWTPSCFACFALYRFSSVYFCFYFSCSRLLFPFWTLSGTKGNNRRAKTSRAHKQKMESVNRVAKIAAGTCLDVQIVFPDCYSETVQVRMHFPIRFWSYLTHTHAHTRTFLQVWILAKKRRRLDIRYIHILRKFIDSRLQYWLSWKNAVMFYEEYVLCKKRNTNSNTFMNFCADLDLMFQSEKDCRYPRNSFHQWTGLEGFYFNF